MAYDFPEAVFIGTDTIEPIAPYDLTNVPDNIRFEKSYILDQLNQPDNAFIFVHQRFMYTTYSNDDIPLFMKELKRTVKPGGYLELVETDVVPKRAGPLFKRVMDIGKYVMRGRQASLYHGPRLRQLLLDYGFQEVTSDYGSVPVCWGGYLGKLMYEAMLKLIGPTIYSELMDGEEYCEAKYMDYIDKAFDECVQHQTFFNLHWAYGRKPPIISSKA
ncbi:hypothetical protein BX666DRAFT_1852849 [Dichotomocladium elegans]|nr:hypothetical protein BX666DRAFT_1852849 [Dichotomocladium elegans]